MRILHIGPDSQFVQYLGGRFESLARGGNVFVTISNEQAVKYPVHGASHIVAKPNSTRLLRAMFSLGAGAHGIIAHGLTREAALLFSILRKPVKIWSGWGFDYYGQEVADGNSLLSPATRAYLTDASGDRQTSVLRSALRILDQTLKGTAAKSADYFSAPIPTDFRVMREAFPGFSGEYLQLNYGDVETMFFAGVEDSEGSNILVGNSSSVTNRHEEVFAKLAECDLRGRMIIAPLSYGDGRYRDFVIQRGRHYFGDAFLPLVDYMPLHEYVRLISSCNVVMMGHRRQQAVGNIGAAIYHGANVYLDPRCPTYDFFTRRGVGVSSLDQVSGELPVGRKSHELRAADRKVLEGFWGSGAVNANVAECLRQIRLRHHLQVDGKE